MATCTFGHSLSVVSSSAVGSILGRAVGLATDELTACLLVREENQGLSTRKTTAIVEIGLSGRGRVYGDTITMRGGADLMRSCRPRLELLEE
jgi:hypothetical protein